MAGTTSPIRRERMHALKYDVVDFTFDNSYVTGGEFVPGLPPLNKIDLVLAPPTKGLVFDFDYATGKLMARRVSQITLTTGSTAAAANPATGAKLINPSSAETVLEVPGTVASTNYTLRARDALGEVEALTDLSTWTIRMVVLSST